MFKFKTKKETKMEPTVNEIIGMNVAQEQIGRAVEVSAGICRDKARKRSGVKLCDRLRRLSEEKKRVSFLVYTPGTEHERPVHSVQMKDFYLKKSKDGNVLVVGRDLEQELMSDMSKSQGPEPGGHRRKSQKVFRSYRLDRIVPRTVLFA